MKKLTFVLALLIVISLGSVFASGSQEEQPLPGQVLELTGRVQLPGYGHVEFVADGVTYELMVPFYLLDEVEIEDGERVTLKGVLVPGPRWDDGEDEKHLAVTEATVDGETYDLGFARGYMRGRMADSRFGSRGYGPDCGPGYGPGEGSGTPGSRGGYGRMGPGQGAPRGGRW